MSPESQQDLLAIVGLVFNHTIRDVDIACRYSNASTFSLILPLTEPLGAQVLLKKIHNAIESYNFKPFSDDRVLKLRLTANTFIGNRDGDNPYQIDESVLKKFLADTEEGLRKT